MKLHKRLNFGGAWVFCLTLAMATTAQAASSLSNSLTGFTGESSQVATQTALAAAGLEFSSTAGLAPDSSNDPRIAMDASGAVFGTFFAANEGRNYMRTIEDDYGFEDWTAEVTVVVDPAGTTPLVQDDIFFGMGSGEITNWGTPDWAGIPTVFMAPQVSEPSPGVFQGQLSSNAVDGISGDWVVPPPCVEGWCSTPLPAFTLTAGTHRLRQTFDFDTKQWVGSMDVNYAGGPFVADGTTLTYDLTTLFDDGGFVLDGFPTNPSKIYFGGDDGVIFKNLSIVVGDEPVEDGDFDNDGDVDGRDFLVWQRGNSPNPLSAGDLALWQNSYGTGGLAAISGVPEPSSLALLVIGAFGLGRRARK
jgi:hypothetical protein